MYGWQSDLMQKKIKRNAQITTPCYKQFLLGLEEPEKSADAENSEISRWSEYVNLKSGYGNFF